MTDAGSASPRAALAVLVVEADHRAAESAAEALRDAGHRVLRCSEPDEPAFPCAGLGGGECPLDASSVDVVLDVRGHPRSTTTMTETGVTCALRDGVPLVVAGRSAFNPFELHAEAVVASTDPSTVVAACEQVVAEPLTRRSTAATEAARAALAATGEPAIEASAEVRRRGGVLDVRVELTHDVSDSVVSAVANHVVAAVREVDRFAAGVDVSVRRPG